MYRKQLITVLREGDTLDMSAPTDCVNYYSSLMIMGNYDDSIKFTLNGIQLVMPGGSTLQIAVESLVVDTVYKNSTLLKADIGIAVFGYQQKNTLTFI